MLAVIIAFLLNIADSVSFDKHIHDFGLLDRDLSPKTCVFKMTNESDDDIEIVMTRTSCSCTEVTRCTNGAIPPGKTAFIFVQYKTELYSSEYIEHDVFIYLKGQKQPVKLQITGHYKN